MADQWLTYRNETYGFSFEYPAAYAEGPYAYCDLRETQSQGGVVITVGERSDLFVNDAQGWILEDYVDTRIEELQSLDPDWALESRESTTQAGVDAVSLGYRFGAFCDIPEIGIYEWDVYPRMISSFEWLDG